MTSPAQLLRETADAVARLGGCASDFEALTDDDLIGAQQVLAAHRRAADTYASWVAGQIAARSHRDLGYAGLAVSKGFTTPEAMIQSITGSTRAEARKYVQVGTLLTDTQPIPGSPEPTGPTWLIPVADAVAAGALAADAAEAIRRGLGVPDAALSECDLTAAAEQLVAAATRPAALDPADPAAVDPAAGMLLVAGLNADQLFREARHLRDDLDPAGVAGREAELDQKRYLRCRRNPDGTVEFWGRFGPEDGEQLIAAIDAHTSPRRGGPRFVDPARKKAADELVADPRSTEQIAADALIGMIRIAADTDPGTMLSGRPCVRVIVTDTTLATRGGFGRIEGTGDAVSLETVERMVCDTGILGIKFDTKGVNVGRDQRLFTNIQRAILAVRDGGCRWPGCDRPPSWSEAHHITGWADGGRTDIDDGILLCRKHHMLLHNNYWQIHRDRGTYWLTPPLSVDPEQHPIEMPSRTPALTQHARTG